MTQKIAIVNQKGGVGKTTTAINVAAQLADANHTVLLLDLDPQGNATSGLGQAKKNSPTTYDVLVKGLTLADAVKETHVAQLFLLPANADLAGAEVELVNQREREFVLRRALETA